MAQQPNPSSESDEVSAASLIKWVLSMFTLTFLVILLVRSDWFNDLLQQRQKHSGFHYGWHSSNGSTLCTLDYAPTPSRLHSGGAVLLPAPHRSQSALLPGPSSCLLCCGKRCLYNKYTEDLEPYLPIAGITAVLLMATGLAYAQQKRSPHRPSHPQNSPAPPKKKHTSAGNAPSSIHIVPPSTPSGQSNTFYQQNIIYNFYFYNVNYNAPPEGNPNSPKPDEE